MIGAIVQARMGSTRLPGKVLMRLIDKPLLCHIVERLRRIKLIDEIIIATTNKAIDKPIEELAREMKTKIFTGKEDDVLDRYYQAARIYKVDIILRITADCPLIDPQIIDNLIKYYLKNKLDYINLPKNYPEGIDAEIFSFEALKKAWQEAKLPSEREHVTPYIWNHPKKFRLGELPADIPGDFSYLHWSVDEERDLKFAREVFKKLYHKDCIFYTKDVLKLLKNEPQMIEINKGLTGQEGYLKSLKEDKVFKEK